MPSSRSPSFAAEGRDLGLSSVAADVGRGLPSDLCSQAGAKSPTEPGSPPPEGCPQGGVGSQNSTTPILHPADSPNVDAMPSSRSPSFVAEGAVTWASFMFVGTILWAFFHFHPDPLATEMLNGVRKAEEIVPYFIVQYVPAGWAGLIIAGALAAAMSTLSASINTASMVWVRDIYKPYIVKSGTDKDYLRVGFIVAGVVSALMMVGAYLFYTADVKTFNDLSAIIGSICGGGMLAVFLFGVFSRRGDSRAIWAALLANALVTTWLLLSNRGVIPASYAWKVDLYYSIIIGNLVTISVAILASQYFKSKVKDFTNLTVWDQEKTPLV